MLVCNFISVTGLCNSYHCYRMDSFHRFRERERETAHNSLSIISSNCSCNDTARAVHSSKLCAVDGSAI